MAVVDGEPGFTQLTKLNILDKLIVQGTAVFNGDVIFAGTVTNTGRWAWQLDLTEPASGTLPNENAAIHLIGDNPFPADLYLENRSDRSNNPSRAPTIVMRRVGDFSLGTTPLQDDDSISHIQFDGWEPVSGAYITGASIDAKIEGVSANEKMPTALTFSAFLSDSGQLEDIFTIGADNVSGNGLLSMSSVSDRRRFTIKNGGNNPITGTFPASSAAIQIFGSSNGHDIITEASNDSPGGAASFILRRQVDSGTVIGTVLGYHNFQGDDNASVTPIYASSVRTSVIVSNNVTDGFVPGDYVITTSASGALDTEAMRVTNDGLVGVGVSEPFTPLHVKKGSSGTTNIVDIDTVATIENAGNSFFTILGGGSNSKGVIFGDRSASGETNVGGIFLTNTDGSDILQLRTGNDQNRLSILSGGNVGINTTTPDSAATLDLGAGLGGFYLPRLTEAQRDGLTTPPLGMQIINSDSGITEVCTKTTGAWLALGFQGIDVPTGTIDSENTIFNGTLFSLYQSSGTNVDLTILATSIQQATVKHPWLVTFMVVGGNHPYVIHLGGVDFTPADENTVTLSSSEDFVQCYSTGDAFRVISSRGAVFSTP